MSQRLRILFITCGIIMAHAAFADTGADTGFYIGADVGAGSAKCSNCSINLNSGSIASTSNSGGVVSAFGGYQLNPYVAAEAGVGALPQMTYNLTATDPTFGNLTYTRTMSSAHIYLALKGVLPLPKDFSLFGKLGVDSQQFAYSDPITDNAVRTSASGTFMAVGAGYHFAPNWTGTASYNQVLTSSSGTNYTTNYVTVGFTYLIF